MQRSKYQLIEISFTHVRLFWIEMARMSKYKLFAVNLEDQYGDEEVQVLLARKTNTAIVCGYNETI